MIGRMEELWAVRGISYEMKVAPIEDNPAAILIRPADTEFSFPPGRYALVLKGVGYDFSVAGPITDPAQCIETAGRADVFSAFTERGRS